MYCYTRQLCPAGFPVLDTFSIYQVKVLASSVVQRVRSLHGWHEAAQLAMKNDALLAAPRLPQQPRPSNQLFGGICAYFVEEGVPSRRLKIWIEKFCQFGGKLEDHFSHEITHVFALDINKLQERVALRKLKRHHVKALKYEWIQDCLKEGVLLEAEPYALKVEDIPQASGAVKEAPVDGVKADPKNWGKMEQDPKTSSVEMSATISSTDFGSDDTGAEVLSSAFHENTKRHGSPSLGYFPPNLNQNITEPFSELRDIYKDALGDDRRSFSYHKAISVLEKLPFKVDNIDQVKGLPTIGKSLREHIYDILTTGKLPKLENFRNDEKVQTLRLFSSIWGIGPFTALKLYEKGHKSLEDLESESSLTASQRVGLQFHHDLQVKIPRHEVKEMSRLVQEVAEDTQSEIVVICGGSYRRGKSVCSDMDFAITHPDGSSHEGFLVKLVAALRKKDFLAESLLVSDHNTVEKTNSGVDTYFGLCKYPGRELRHRIDFKVYPIEMYPFGLIAWTGNDVLNRRLRLLAEGKGYRLDDTGLYPIVHDSQEKKARKNKGTSVALKTEQEVFEFLGFPWLEPHERNL